MKRLLCICMMLALLIGTAQAEGIFDCVRLQVVARDNSRAAQALKLALRDVCVRGAMVCAGDADNADDAYMRISASCGAFEDACRRRAEEMGSTDAISAETGVFSFPDRVYGKIHLPAGEYRALRITIGEGAGHNWFCVLYPSLCVLNEADYAGDDPPCYSEVWEWLKNRIGGAA